MGSSGAAIIKIRGGRASIAALLAGLLSAATGRADLQLPEVGVTPEIILKSIPVAVAVRATFPTGLASIQQVSARYYCADTTSLLLPYTTEVQDHSAQIVVPAVVFPAETFANFVFGLRTSAGESSELLVVNTTSCACPSGQCAAPAACSSHGGVDCCAGPDRNGAAICADGWLDGSVAHLCQYAVSCVDPDPF